MSNQRHLWSAVAALVLVIVQTAVLQISPSELLVRIALPATIAAVPAALWVHRRRLGVWIMFVGLAANVVAIVANGGLMPIERATVVEAVGAERAASYRTGDWLRGSKDVLVTPENGRALALGDAIIIRAGEAGIVASPGDIVVWAGLLVLAGEAAAAWESSRRRQARRVEVAPAPIAFGRKGAGGDTSTPQ